MKPLIFIAIILMTFLVSCSPVPAPQQQTATAPTQAATAVSTATPQPNVELRFFYDWNPQDPFNLLGSGLNSKKDTGEPYLAGFVITYEEQSYTTDENGIVRMLVPDTTATITITVPNTNKTVGLKNLVNLGIQFNMTMYEPNRVSYGPRFFIDLQNDHCQRSGGRILCEVGIADGYITSPYSKENYLYSSPWTFDSGLNYEKDFVSALVNGQIPSPAGDMYQIGELGKLIANYVNTSNHGVPYGFPYLLRDPPLGINGVEAHMFMDVRNDLGISVYAPVGGTVCKGNSSDYAICAIDVTVDINDIRAIPNGQYGLKVTRGQLIGWTDPINNITDQKKPFPLIHMGNFETRDRVMTLSHFPYLTAEQIVMGAKPDQNGQIYVASRDQIISDYNYKVHLPHASTYADK